MKKNIEKIKKLRDSNEGVVGIVVAVLIIGLFVIIITTIQTIYVPNWMEQKEAEHMEEIANQFSMLKYAIDTQLTTEKAIPISTSIKLGSKEMPFFLSSRSFGSLDILSDQFILSICSDTNTYSYSFGTIKYSSKNSYFLDQSYIYEGGAVIMDQYKGNVMAINPSFSVELDPYTYDINISLNIANISRVKEKISVSGYGTYPLRTEFSNSSSPVIITGVNNLTINTKYANAWEIFFNRTLTESEELEYGTHFSISKNSNGLTIDFFAGSVWDKPNVIIKVYNINAQVCPGWI
jgi:hypothetical protein